MRLIILLSLTLASLNCFSFDWKKCQTSLKTTGANIFTASTIVLGSTTSYVSSTGDCAMNGKPDIDKMVFISQNLDHLKTDAAQGNGEHLIAYAKLCGCNDSGKHQFAQVTKSNFKNIFGETSQYEAEVVYKEFEKILIKDKILKSECAVEKLE